VVTVSPAGSDKQKFIGVPIPGVEMKVVRRDTKHICGLEEIGEICVRSRQVTTGYRNMPELNASTFDSEGFFKTGDAGYYDRDGSFKLVDRYKDIIKCDGHQVASSDIEAVINSNSDILESAVIGVPHPDYGESLKAYVVKRRGSKLRR